MTHISRRRFLSTVACSVAAARLSAQTKAEIQVALTIPSEAAGPRIPEDFVGLSYEVQQLTDPTFFSAQNDGLVRSFKALAPKGVLRLGGNSSEFGWWKPTPASPEPEHPQVREVIGEPKAKYYPVTPEAVRNLTEFLHATGWNCIYGIGMGTNTPERAADEAEFVAKTLGSKLKYFQIGNEADLFDRHLRDPKTWSVNTYLDEWMELANAVAARVPSAQFGLPDVAGAIDWLTQIANQWSSLKHPPRVAALTHHYYFGGPATNPDVNIPNLLKPATMAKVQATADTANAAAAKMGVPVRMTEGNTCYRGGKPGVSDVFAAALWSADYALLLAANGYTGLNLHGGTGKSVANSVGGVLPGDTLLTSEGAGAEQIASHPHPFYTPIATFGAEYILEPVAYGLKFAGSFAGATLFDAGLTQKLQAAGINATAYAARLADGTTAVAVLNKDAENDLSLRVDFGNAKTAPATIETLAAPSIDSREAHIAQPEAAGQLKDGKITIHIRRASGLLVRVG
ncbi:MAG: hypothetical protein WBP85_03745 [Terracidiphilus sp.]